MSKKDPLEDFQRLLTEFSNLPQKKQTRTFMQVAGYPHYYSGNETGSNQAA